MPPLNVLPAAPSDPLRLFHRAQLQWSRAIADEVPLACGTWLRSPSLQPLPAANCVLDAALEPGGDPAALVAEVNAAAAACPVRGWTLNPSLSADRTAPLADHLVRTGWRPDPLHVLRLDRLAHDDGRPPPADVTVVPARSAYGPFRRLMAARFATAAEVDAAELHLDDPHVDAWVALRGGHPVAAVSLLNDGQTATVTDLFAPADLSATMLRRAAESAGRAGHTLLLAGTADVAPFAAVGFKPLGRWVQYVRPAAG